MNKFKKGDIIVGKESSNCYHITSKKNNFQGVVVEVCTETDIRVKQIKGDINNKGIYDVESRHFELKNKNKSIKETKCDYKRKDDVICDYISIGDYTIAVPHGCPIGVTKKHEDDEYNFESAKAYSTTRLLEDAKKRGVI